MRVLLFLVLAWTAVAQPPADLRGLVRDSLKFLDPAKNRAAGYTFSFRNDRKELDSSGAVKSQESVIGERIFQDGVSVFRIAERNGRKLTEDELRRQQDNIDARLAEMRGLSQEERERRSRKAAENQAWLKEIADALEFQYVGEEPLNGRTAVVLTCSPRPGYSASNMRARVFEKTKGRLWIDKTDRELMKADAEVFDTVNIGFGLFGRVEKGTRFHIERQRLTDGVWVMDNQTIRFGARVLLVKWIGNEIHSRYWNYRPKQQTTAKTLQSEVQAASSKDRRH